MAPTHAPSLDEVLVVDFGAQYAQLIARRVREAHVYAEIVPHSITADEIRRRRPAALILSGGPASVYADGAPGLDEEIFALGLPILGICYGQQLLAQALGGTVAHTGRGEYGKTPLEVSEPGVLLAGTPDTQTVWMSHRDAVTEPPPGFAVTASTGGAPCAAIEDPDRSLYGIQFHPEVSHTPHGAQILRRFLYQGAGCHPDWTPVNIIDRLTGEIRDQVGQRQVLCGLSGGVDSSVAAALVHRAVGDQLTCVFVDHGLLRHDEAEQVEATFRDHFDVSLIHRKEADRFLQALEGVTDPEQKRSVIGEHFIRVFEETAEDLSLGRSGAEPAGRPLLVQGTLYPDVIESGSPTAATIKSHHNVGGLPEQLGLELIEPLRDLFKDEVRTIGEELGLPEGMVWRQPFPGPGLAVRIVGEVTRERCRTVRAADRIVLEELDRTDLPVWQSFAALLPIRSVGVMGDERTYGHTVVVRAVTSEDGMTADWVRVPDGVLEKISGRITAEVEGINRVVYDITSKPPGTIEWE